MHVLRSIAGLSALSGPVSLAIGVFDGVHLGHQAVIGAALENAAHHGGEAVVVTFDPHPARVIRPEQSPRMLCSTAHKLAIIERLGVRQALVCAFDEAFSRIEARAFVGSLAAACQRLAFISVGFAWRFGHRGAGDIHLLADLGQELGFCVHGVPPVRVAGEVVSSTLIRDAVTAGDFDRASRFLGRGYTVAGTVMRGDQLGRQIGFPTANVDVHCEQLPPPGVYAVRALWDGRSHPAVANLGRRPTVSQSADLTLEAHLLDFEGDLYGREMEIAFVQKLRDEVKFPGLDELKAQIARDTQAARAALRG